MGIKFKKTIRIEARKEAKRLIDEYEISDAGGLVLIQTFADAFTTELNAQDIVNKEGLTSKDRFGQTRAHPLLTVIRDSRAQKMAALKQLNLDLEPLKEKPGRPSGR
jgi:hypothetical protein